jgi:hypothetical protein
VVGSVVETDDVAGWMGKRTRVFLERLEERSGDVDGAMYIPSFWTGVGLRPRQLVVK